MCLVLLTFEDPKVEKCPGPATLVKKNFYVQFKHACCGQYSAIIKGVIANKWLNPDRTISSTLFLEFYPSFFS
jgi:hypothetical protein